VIDELIVALGVELRAMTPDDWPAVAEIYWDGMRDGLATFETELPTWPEWDAAHHADHRLAAERFGHLIGWAALAPVSRRRCYAGVAENSVYVARSARGRGVGRTLLEALCAGAEEAGIWTIQCSVFPENAASVALHEACGFRVVGFRDRLAQRDGIWRDVLLLERRSEAIE